MAFTTSKLPAPSRPLFIRCIAVLITFSTVLILVSFRKSFSFHLFRNNNSDGQFSASYPTHCPNIGSPSLKSLDQDANTYLTKFASYEAYESLSPENDVLWDALLPPNGGFVVTYDDVVSKPTQPANEDDDFGHDEHKSHHHHETDHSQKQKHSTGISMFHQLHCLGMIRGAIQTLYARIEELEGGAKHTHGDHVSHRRGDGNESSGHDHLAGHDHWTHCFDYLRQVIILFSV